MRILESLGPLDDPTDRLGVAVAVELMERRPREVIMFPQDLGVGAEPGASR